MDLLAGYDSDATSSSSSSSRGDEINTKINNTEKPSSSVLPTKSILKNPKSQINIDPTSILNHNKSSSLVSGSAINSITNNKSNNTKLKKGKRILRLNAILPPEIVDRLTRSTVQSGAGLEGGMIFSDQDDDSDSDSDQNDDSNINVTNKRKIKKKGIFQNNDSAQTIQNQNVFNDKELNSLLSELHKTGPSQKELSSSTSKSSKTSIIPDSRQTLSDSQDNHTEHDSQKLGFAFMNVSTTVERKKRKQSEKSNRDDDGDLDVHKPVVKKSAALRTSVQSDHNDLGHDSVSHNHHSQENRSDPLLDSHDSQNQDIDNNKTDVNYVKSSPIGIAPNMGPKQHPVVPNTTPSVSLQSRTFNLKRPMNAAPNVSSSMHYTSVKIPITQLENNHQQQSQQTSSHFQHLQQTEAELPITHKKSKKEIEKALRSGDFSSIQSTSIDITSSTHDNSSFSKAEQQLVESAMTVANQPRTFKKLNLPMYAPKGGGDETISDTKDLSHRVKSKHQIHTLVTHAANLEAAQMRSAGAGNIHGAKGRSRADAKKRYGW